MQAIQSNSVGSDATLLVLDDDIRMRDRLGRALAARGFTPSLAETVHDAIAIIDQRPPAFAVLDLQLGDGSGLDVARKLRDRRPDAKIVILSGYGSLFSAVRAVKSGAVNFLSKPSDSETVAQALLGEHAEPVAMPENPMSASRARWEHIQRVYELCGRNISETARRLGMHRRTLQRILGKRAPQ